MCLIALGLGVSREYPLVLAANRDERHARATAAADWWTDQPTVLGGRDLVAGGSWLAVARTGRLAAVTNFFEPGALPRPQSRGALVASFVQGRVTAADFSRLIGSDMHGYGGFNLLLFAGVGVDVEYVSNRAPARRLGTGIHALSNAAPDSDWHKLARARAALETWLARRAPADALLDALGERSAAADDATRYRRSMFIVGEEFGTRCSTIVLFARGGSVLFVERRFDAAGRPSGESRYEFALEMSSGNARRSITASAEPTTP